MTDVPGFRVVGRASQELLLTFSGFGVYFRFVYTVWAEYVEYGSWSVGRDGTRHYSRVGTWPITAKGPERALEPGSSRDLFLPAVHAIMNRSDTTLSRAGVDVTSAYGLRGVIPDVVVPPCVETP